MGHQSYVLLCSKMTRNKKKRVRLSLVHPQGQALGVVGVDALDMHVGVGVVVHPKLFFSPRETMFCLFFSQLKKKKKICASSISNTTWFQEYILNE